MNNFIEGLQISLIGMGIVFFILFIISLILSFFQHIFVQDKNKITPVTKSEKSNKLIHKNVLINDEADVILVITTVFSELLSDNEYIINIKKVD